MTDLDRLLRPDVAHAAAEAVVTPDFASLERRGIRRRRARSLLAAGAAGLAVLVAVEATPRMLGSERDTITPLEQPSPRPMPLSDTVLDPGTYLVTRDESAAVDYTVTFPADWFVQNGNQFGRLVDSPEEFGFLPFVVDEIYADPCLGDRGRVTKVGPRAQDLVTALLAQPGPVKSAPVRTTVGGYPATRIDLRLPESLRAQNCFLGPGTGVQLWRSRPARYMVLDDTGRVSVYVVDVNGIRQVFASQYHSERISERDLAELRQVLASIRIVAPRN